VPGLGADSEPPGSRAAGRRRRTSDICGGVRQSPDESRFAARLRRTGTEAFVRMAEGRRSGRQDGRTAEGGNPPTPRRGYGGQRKRRRESVQSKGSERPAADRRRASGAFSADARRRRPSRRRKRRHAASVPSTSGAAQRRTLPSPASSRARSLGAEGLAGRVPSESSRTSTRHDKPRATGASGDAGAVCAASPRASIALCQHRSEGGSPSHAGQRQRRAGHGPERWHHRPRSGAERRERPSRERDASGGTIPAGRGRRGAERGRGSSRRDSFAGAAGAGRASPTTPGPGSGSSAGTVTALLARSLRGRTAPATAARDRASRDSGERGDYRPTLAQDQDDDHDPLPANAVLLLEPGSDIKEDPRPYFARSAAGSQFPHGQISSLGPGLLHFLPVPRTCRRVRSSAPVVKSAHHAASRHRLDEWLARHATKCEQAANKAVKVSAHKFTEPLR